MNKKTSGTTVSHASTWKKRLGFLCGAILVVAICLGIKQMGGGQEKAAATPPEQPRTQNYPVRQATSTTPIRSSVAAPTTPRTASLPARDPATSGQKSAGIGSAPKKLVTPVVAEVNNRKITRDELAQSCLQHYGEEVMETMRNRYLIVIACREENINISRAEVDAEIERLASKFKLPVDQWLKMLKQERGISGDQYAEEIIWPTLALRKLAGEKTKVTRDEIQKEYEVMYGSQAMVRLIALKDSSKAEKIRKDAAAHADDVEYFGKLAKDHSVDAPSAANKGIIQPILHHGTYPEIEKVAFGLKVGEVSPVIPVKEAEQYVILRKEREDVAARKRVLDEVLAGQLEVIIRDRKLRTASAEIFKNLRKEANVEDVWNNPELRKQHPDVAALIGGHPIPMSEFIKATLDRHGEEVLQGMIARTLIEIEAQRNGITVTQADLDAEVARAASAELKPNADGSPDVENFKKMIAIEQRMKFDIYLRDLAWPAAALRKLAEPTVKITADDLKKGFEANYGPRVRCLAIVLNNQRKANEVWEMARKRNSSDYFGDLAAEYSIEPGSQALRGEIPPIKKNGGQPKLEEEAFRLKPGELSGVIQIASEEKLSGGEKFVILRCESYTEPVEVQFAQVKKVIQEDLYEKKLRLAMIECFEDLQAASTIDNYLTGLSHAPNRKQLVGAEEANAISARREPTSYQQLKKK